MTKKVISGGQTGADVAGLRAAKTLGIPTGGYIPKGFKTENGPTPILGERYGLIELPTGDYPTRTRKNILSSDGTIIFADIFDRGSKLTQKLCTELDIPCLPVMLDEDREPNIDNICRWIRINEIETLNIAGNRNSKSPGIESRVMIILWKVFSTLEEQNGK